MGNGDVPHSLRARGFAGGGHGFVCCNVYVKVTSHCNWDSKFRANEKYIDIIDDDKNRGPDIVELIP